MLCLLYDLLHAFVLVEAFAVALETCLYLLVDVFELTNDPGLQVAQVRLRALLDLYQIALRFLAFLLVFLEGLVCRLEVLADLRENHLLARQLPLIHELHHNERLVFHHQLDLLLGQVFLLRLLHEAHVF